MNSLFPLTHRRVLWGTVLLIARFFARREEKQILRCAQDDMSFRAKRSGARNLLLVAAFCRAVITACLVSGFVVLLIKIPVQAPKGALSGPNPEHVAQGSHFNPAAFPAGSTAQAGLVEAYGKLPLSFELNKGQTDSQVRFLSRGSGYSLFLTGNEAVLALKKPIQMANGKRCSAGLAF